MEGKRKHYYVLFPGDFYGSRWTNISIVDFHNNILAEFINR